MTLSYRTIILILVLSLVQGMSACAPRSPMPAGTINTKVTIKNTEVRQIKSSATGRDYDIYVRLPDKYVPGDGMKYPVIYSLDGQWDFKLLDSIYGGLQYDGVVPELIIIGITYSGDNPDIATLRSLDYTPVKDMMFPDSGEGSKFFTFLKGQLIPYVESNYPIDPSQRVLMGHSFGGTFTLYALFTEPTLFSRYIAASPIVVLGDGFAYRQEADYARDHQDLPLRLFVSVGGLEDLVQPVQGFTQIIKNRNYQGLEMETRVIEGERHAGSKPEAFNRGLRFVFQGK